VKPIHEIRVLMKQYSREKVSTLILKGSA